MGNAYLSAPITAKDSSEGSSARVAFGVASMQGWRSTMEDTHISNLNLDRNTSLFGVFDGHGGKEVAVFASRHLATELVMNTSFQTGRTERALAETFIRMDELLRTVEGIKEIYKIFKNLPDSTNIDFNQAKAEGPSSGCTAVVAVLQGSRLYVANAGDSRCVLARQGTAIAMSIDHKPELADELARIQSAGGFVSEGRVNGNLNLSRCLGDLEFKSNPALPPEQQILTAAPEIKSLQLTPADDFIVMCCDGIWDILTSQQCVDFIYQRIGKEPLVRIAEALCDHCLAPDVTSREGRGCDNMTALIVALKHPL